MQRNRWGWRWASGILGAVCLTLVAVTFLLPPEDEPPAASRTNIAEPAAAPEPDAAGLAADTANVAPRHETLGGAVRAESAASPARAPSPSGAASTPLVTTLPGQGIGFAPARLERQKVAASLDDESNKIVPKSHTDSKLEIVKPLGYVETADGQKKAIIGEGEWIQLVAEGQTLEDASRVVKVTPTSVEIVPGNETDVASKTREPRPPEAAHAQVASAASGPPVLGTEAGDQPEVADAASEAESIDSPGPPARIPTRSAPAQARLPHEGEAEASLASNWRVPPARPEPRLTEPEKPADTRLPVDSALPPSASQPATGSSKPLGFVEKADGTTLTVMADGDSVRLEEQPQIASVMPPSYPADLSGGIALEIPKVRFRLASWPGSRTGPGNGIGPAATLKALGYVRQADGRLQGILDEGDSVQLVEEGQVLADGSQVVGITSTSVEVAFEPNDDPTRLPAREQDLLAAATPGSGMLLRWRAPPTEARLAAPEPVPKARGMPAMGGRAAYSRPPPNHTARDWIEERSREQPPEEAGQASTTTRTLPASIKREFSLATYGRGEGEVRLEKGGSADTGGRCARPERYSIRSVGFVEWSGGRLQAIVSQGESVELLEEGRTLADGSQVVAVSRHAVELSRGVTASRRSRGAGQELAGDIGALLAVAEGARGNGPSTGQELPPAGPSRSGASPASGLAGEPDSVANTQRAGGAGLHLNRPMRDNGDEPHK